MYDLYTNTGKNHQVMSLDNNVGFFCCVMQMHNRRLKRRTAKYQERITKTNRLFAAPARLLYYVLSYASHFSIMKGSAVIK